MKTHHNANTYHNVILFVFYLYSRVRRRVFVFFSSRRRHTRWPRDWSSDVCSSDLGGGPTRRELMIGCHPRNRGVTLRCHLIWLNSLASRQRRRASMRPNRRRSSRSARPPLRPTFWP